MELQCKLGAPYNYPRDQPELTDNACKRLLPNINASPNPNRNPKPNLR